MRRRLVALAAPFLLVLGLASPAQAIHDEADHSLAMNRLVEVPNLTGATNSDLAFWGNRAYAANYGGVRIFDISRPGRPTQLVDFRCFGPQNDVVVWRNRLMFTAVDRTLTGPECGATATESSADPEGWEGVRIFDVSNPRKPRYIDAVYTDCGAHTITLYPKSRDELLLYVSSYPLAPGPTCGAVNGPPAGNSPLHEKISVISVPTDDPADARVVAEPPISYPGDPDNRFDPQEHAFPEGFGDLTACHDIGVFVELKLAAAACAEQAQLWRIDANGIPDTANPVWVYDDGTDTDGPGGGDVAVDFWHSATFSWDGKIVNFIDESFGVGCPTVTPIAGVPSDTGRMFFLDRRTGEKLSHFQIPRPESALNEQGEETAYCSAHLGTPVPTDDAYLLVNAWYEGGADVIDFTDPRNPVEIAFWDARPAGAGGSNTWAAYWYEGRAASRGGLTVYGNDIGRGLQVFDVTGAHVDDAWLPYLNPQTQVRTFGSPPARAAARRARAAALRGATRVPAGPSPVVEHLAP